MFGRLANVRIPPALARIFIRIGLSGSLLLLVILYVVLIGINFDISSWRSDLVQKVTAALGREVRFEGALQLEISARPKIRAGGFSIANATGFPEGDMATLGEARLALDLWPLLLGRLRIQELAGSDVHIRLQQDRKGRNNWTFATADTPKQETAATSSVEEVGKLFARLDIERVALDTLEVDHVGADGKRHYFALESLEAHFPHGSPLNLSLRGTVEKKYPYRIELNGSPLAVLADPGKPWPFDLKLEFMSSHLALHGSVASGSGKVEFDLESDHVAEFGRLLSIEIPRLGKANLSGVAQYGPGIIALEAVKGSLGRSTLDGHLQLSYGGVRPRIQGELALPKLDMRPFLTGKTGDEEDDAPKQSLADLYRELNAATFDLSGLRGLDADLTLRVGQWLNLPGEVHDAMLQVKLHEGKLAVPIHAVVAGVGLSGQADIDARRSPARFRLSLGSRDSTLGGLAGLAGMQGVTGHLQRLDMRIAARGNRGAQLMQSLDIKLALERGELAYGSKEKPVHFTLDHFVVGMSSTKPLQGEARGTLLEKPFELDLRSDTLVQILQREHMPLDLALRAGSAHAALKAQLYAPESDKTSEINLELDAPHSSEVASWLGLLADTDVPVLIKGKFRMNRAQWHLSDFGIRLGRSVLRLDMSRVSEEGKPLLKMNLSSEMIDVDELQALLPATEAKPESSQQTAAMIDIPILPARVSLADTDIEVRIGNIASASPFAVRDLRFDGRIRDGMMYASPFAAKVAEMDLSGAIQLDLRTQTPHAELWLATNNVDIGSLMSRLGMSRNFDAEVKLVVLHLDLHSSHLGELLAHSELSINFEGGQLTMQDANTDGKLRVAIDQGELKSPAGAPIHLQLNGSIDTLPVAIRIKTATAADLLIPDRQIPFDLLVEAQESALHLSGDVDRPLSKSDVELELTVQGTRLDKLNPLVRTSLPPWGPWSISGKFHMTAQGYELPSLLLQVGSSRLQGWGKLDTAAVPVRADIVLAAPTIQLDDFRFGDWSPEKKKVSGADKKQPLQGSKKSGTQEVQQMLSLQMLRRQDAYLKVQVDKVLSGQDELGNGRLEVKLQDGRAEIGPMVVDTPGGSATLWMGYEPGEKDVAIALRAEAQHFDYGILARRFDKRSDMSGTFSLDVDVSARAQSLSELLRYGKGHINFAVWPENLRSEVIDIWAVNVLVALLSVIDSTQDSKVNCAIGRFNLADGKLSDKGIFIDTSRMRVSGKGEADFHQQSLQFYVSPKAKTPQFLSLALPVEVTGYFGDFKVGVRAADVLEMVGQFATSVFWVPIMSLFGRDIPVDGKDVCGAEAFN